MSIVVFNGWAASERAWSLCGFRADRIVSYLDPEPELDGECTVVGWSLGGNRAIRFASRHQASVKRLVLLSPIVRMMKDENWPGMGEGRLKAFLAAFEMFQGEGLGGGSYPVNPYQVDSHEDLKRGIDYLHDSDMRDSVRLLSPGTAIRIFHAEGDIIANIENSRHIVRVCPWARLDELPGREHALPVTIPERITGAVLEN